MEKVRLERNIKEHLNKIANSQDLFITLTKKSEEAIKKSDGELKKIIMGKD